MRRNWLVAIALTVLMTSLAAPLMALPTSASEPESNDTITVLSESEHWLKLESPIVTALFPRGGEKPMFIWWYTNRPDQVYVVKFQGLIEWLTIDHPGLPNPDYYSSLRNASAETWSTDFNDWYFQPMEEQWMMTNMQMRTGLVSMATEMMTQMDLTWHSPFLDFSAAQWALSDIHNITASDGKIIGVAFAFTLAQTPQPRFQFAENNVMIRIRFYNTTVQETVPGTSSSYTVNAGEMKMDLVINKWVWNLDYIKAFLTRLQSDFNINIPNAESRLALWVNLASINITRTPLTEAEGQPEGIEQNSTSTVMQVDDHMESMGMTTDQEQPIETSNPIVRIQFANQTETLAGFFRFVAQAKVTNYPNQGDVNMVPVRAAFRGAGAHMKLFLAYPYFGNGTLEHDPSIGVDAPGISTTPQYTVIAPTGNSIVPTSVTAYVPPLFNTELVLGLIVVASGVAILLYLAKWKRKTPVNMVGPATARTTS